MKTERINLSEIRFSHTVEAKKLLSEVKKENKWFQSLREAKEGWKEDG